MRKLQKPPNIRELLMLVSDLTTIQVWVNAMNC